MQMLKMKWMQNRGPLVNSTVIFAAIFVFMFLLSQTVFAQNTYVITDGSRVLVHTTFATDPAAVLTEAGLELNAEDTYTTQKGDGVSEITVQRGETAEVTLENDPQVLESVETYTTSIPYDVRYCYDSTLPEGTEKVLTEGEYGQMICTANVVYKDGTEISRDVVSRSVATQPVAELIAKGTGSLPAQERLPDTVQIGDGIITLPTGEVLTFIDTMQVVATAYDWQGITAMGTTAREGAIAVDPSVIPYGTRMFIVSNDGAYVYGVCTAEDTGHPDFISGNRIDLFYESHDQCIQFGVRDCTVYILGEADFSYGENP